MGYLDGFRVTFKKLFEQRVTTEYPKEKRPKPIPPARPPRPQPLRGRHGEVHRLRAVRRRVPGPVHLRAGGRQRPDDPVSPGERYGFVYEINYLRCIHCDLCVEACPTEAITESKLFEFSFTNRSDAIYTKDELLVDDEGQPQQLPWEDWRRGRRRRTPRPGCGPPRPAAAPPTWARSVVGRAGLRREGRPSRAREAAPVAGPRGRRSGSTRPRTTTTGTTRALMDVVVFVVGRDHPVGGAIGVVLSRNPVHAALSLVPPCSGSPCCSSQQEAHFLAAVQVIVYAGAIVVLFLFVIMLLGVDQAEVLAIDPLAGSAPVAAVAGGRARPRCCSGVQAAEAHRGPSVPASVGRDAPTWRTSAGRSSPTTCSPSRSPRCCSSSPWSAPWCWPAPPPARSAEEG